MTAKRRRTISVASLMATLGGLALVLMTLVLGAGAATGTNINIGNGTVSVGSSTTTSVTVTLAAEDAAFNGYDITIAFDQTKATVNSVAAAGSWSFFPQPVINNAAGTVRVTGVLATPANCGTPCAVFTINWQGIAAGTPTLTLVPRPGFPPLAREPGEEITPFGVTNGTLTVQGPVTNTPTNTNTPVTPTTVTSTATTVTSTATTVTSTATTVTSTATTVTTTTTPPTSTATSTTQTPTSTSGAGTATSTATSTATATPTSSTTPIPGGPRNFKLYLPYVASDGIVS